jgi:uncharacterized protein (TIGR00369 family)
MLRDLQFSFIFDDDAPSRAFMPVVPEICDARGTVRTGVLATLVDVVGGGTAMHAAYPNWIATADLSLDVFGTAGAGSTIEARPRVLRAGRTTVVLEVELVDVAIATMSFSALPRRDSNPDANEVAAGDRTTMTSPSSRLTQPIEAALGAKVVDGAIEVPVTDWARNTMGAMQGGLVALTADLAGEHALQRQVTSLHIVYLGFGRVGPVRASAEVLAPNAAHVELVDTGADHRRMAIARVGT